MFVLTSPKGRKVNNFDTIYTMLDYCKNTCLDRYSEVCALPSMTNRFVKSAGVIGAILVDGLARTGAAFRGKYLDSDGTGIITASTTIREASHIPAEACVWLHKVQESCQED